MTQTDQNSQLFCLGLLWSSFYQSTEFPANRILSHNFVDHKTLVGFCKTHVSLSRMMELPYNQNQESRGKSRFTAIRFPGRTEMGHYREMSY